MGFQKDNTHDSVGIYQIEGRDGLVWRYSVVQVGEWQLGDGVVAVKMDGWI